jgi:RAB protein geranylgeranyltransferase component A
MMCNYGSSEYAQAFSRIGSLYGNVYIVNEDIDIQKIDKEDGKVTSLEINYNDTSVAVSKGIICGHHYRNLFEEFETSCKKQMLRVTLITKK